jgi:hypothetical protein
MKINSVARNISPRIVSWMITALLALLLHAGWLVDLHPLRWETLPGALGWGVIALAGLAGAGLSCWRCTGWRGCSYIGSRCTCL